MEIYSRQKTMLTDDSRIFHRPECRYDPVQEALDAHFGDNAMTVALRRASGKALKLSVECVGEGVFRLRAWEGRGHFANSSEMLAVPEVAAQKAALRKSEHAFTLTAGKHSVRVRREPFGVELVEAGGKVLWQVENDDPVAPGLGIRLAQWGQHPFLSWRITNGERLFGLGEKFNKVEKTGTRATIWTADTCGTNTCDLAYKAVPVLFSTRGWGMMLHSTFRSYWEVGAVSYTAGSLLVEDERMDLLLFAAPTLKALLGRYTALTGRPLMPPKWAFGVWLSRCMYRSRREAEQNVRGMRERGIPVDVVHLDPAWMRTHYYPKLGVDACDFDWNEEQFPDRAGMYRSFAEDGVAVCHWINPYLPGGQPIYEEARERGFLVKGPDGAPARGEYGDQVGMVDFTNPEAKEWWKDHLKELLRDGAAVFKPDYGERVPEDAVFHNGKTGAEMHNLYLFLYNQAVFEATREVTGYNLIWGRSGYIGSQRYPGTWAGDTQTTWHAMRCCLRGGLSAGLTGWSFWSCDIGGFCRGVPTPELYTRWAQWGLLVPFSRFHGNTPREPWHFGAEAVRVVRRYARLRYSLVPYLLAAAEESARAGVPMMRHMALEFPREPNVDTLDDQYMLGPDLLVAPVMEPGARSRQVYVPEGIWTELERPAVSYVGPGFYEVAAPLERVPLLVREGAVIPRLTGNPLHLKGGPAKHIEVDVYPGTGARSVSYSDEGVRVRMRAESSERAVRFEIRPAPLKVRVRFMQVQADSARVNGEAVPTKVTRDATVLELDAHDGAAVEL